MRSQQVQLHTLPLVGTALARLAPRKVLAIMVDAILHKPLVVKDVRLKQDERARVAAPLN